MISIKKKIVLSLGKTGKHLGFICRFTEAQATEIDADWLIRSLVDEDPAYTPHLADQLGKEGKRKKGKGSKEGKGGQGEGEGRKEGKGNKEGKGDKKEGKGRKEVKGNKEGKGDKKEVRGSKKGSN